MTTSLSFSELLQVHKHKTQKAKEPGFDAEFNLAFENYVGPKELSVLSLIPTSLLEGQKKVLVIAMTSRLKDLMAIYIASLTAKDYNKGFYIPVGALISTVVFPSLGFINNDKQDILKKDLNDVIWCLWVSMAIIRSHGWMTEEYPKKFRQVEREGQLYNEFNATMFDSVLVYIDPQQIED